MSVVKRPGPSFEQTGIPFTQGLFVPNSIEKWLSSSGEGIL